MGARLDLSDDAVRAAVATRLGRLYADRPVILAVGALAAATGPVRWLRELGCRVLVVCTTRGAAEMLGPDEAQVVQVTAPAGGSVTEQLRAHDRLFRTLPAHALAAIEAFDPERRGVWLATPSVTDDAPIAGRPVTGGRPTAYLALEDKVLADDIWRAAGVPAAPACVVGVDRAALAAATAAVGGPLGAVWSGDARDGFHGGGDFVRWVATEADTLAAFAFFAPRCDRVRVMPFLDGVPCSIHGMVLPDAPTDSGRGGTAVFRPVEVAMLRDPARRRFVHGGLGTYWDPPAPDRAEMRAAAHRVGEHLRTAYSYRGAFGIDGVLTVDGFRPTELNPRLSAGLTTVTDFDPRFATFLQATLVAGLDPGLGVAEVESLVRRMDGRRSGRPLLLVKGLEVGPAQEFPVTWDGRTLHRSSVATADVVTLAATPRGGFARLVPGSFLRPGDRLADLDVALADLLDREYAAGPGPLEAAPDVRSSRARITRHHEGVTCS